MGHVAAFLASLDISDFNPKAAPPKTEAFWAIVDANRAPEDSELADAIDRLGQETIGEDGEPEIIRPQIITIDRLALVANGDFALWLKDPKSRRAIPHRLEECGYTPVRNPHAKDGLWKINGRRQAVYAQSSMTPREQMEQASTSPGSQWRGLVSAISEVSGPPLSSRENPERRNGAVDDSARIA